MTNIGVSHIGQLGSRENIMAEKLHITDAFGPDSVLFVNGDDPLLATLREARPDLRQVWFGFGEGCVYRAVQVVREGETVRFTAETPFGSVEVHLPVPGDHNVRNALAALAVTCTLGGSLQQAADALAAYQPPAMRQQIRRAPAGFTVIDDSYNASPDAAFSSLEVLAGFRAAAWPCWPTCSSSAAWSGKPTRRWVAVPPAPVCRCSSRWASAPAGLPRGQAGSSLRSHAAAFRRMRRRLHFCAAPCFRGTLCS